MGTMAKLSFLTVSIGLSYLIVAQVAVVRPAAPANAAPITARPAPALPTWAYSDDQDEMGRGVITYASLKSTNAVTFGFPYGGPQRATLWLRRDPVNGKSVILQLAHGQFLCHRDDCEVTVRLDGGTLQRFQGAEPADYRTGSIFIQPYERLVSQLRKAKTVQIEAMFYQEGRRVFEFNVEGLTWDRPASSAKHPKAKGR